MKGEFDLGGSFRFLTVERGGDRHTVYIPGWMLVIGRAPASERWCVQFLANPVAIVREAESIYQTRWSFYPGALWLPRVMVVRTPNPHYSADWTGRRFEIVSVTIAHGFVGRGWSWRFRRV